MRAARLQSKSMSTSPPLTAPSCTPMFDMPGELPNMSGGNSTSCHPRVVGPFLPLGMRIGFQPRRT
jgi:hypothetical protein